MTNLAADARAPEETADLRIATPACLNEGRASGGVGEALHPPRRALLVRRIVSPGRNSVASDGATRRLIVSVSPSVSGVSTPLIIQQW